MRSPGTSLNRRYPLPSGTQAGPSPPSKPSALSISSLATGSRMASSAGSNLKKLLPAGAWGLAVFAAALGACAFDAPHEIASIIRTGRHNADNRDLLMFISDGMWKRAVRFDVPDICCESGSVCYRLPPVDAALTD